MTWQRAAQQGWPEPLGHRGAAAHGVHEGFAYSEAMAALKDEPWDYAALNEFMLARKGPFRAPKWPMAASRRMQDRANLLAYLATLSDTPVPFPAP
jgi:cytochrome c